MGIYTTNVTDFSLTFLRLVMQLTMSTFSGDFSKFSGELYYYNSTTDIEKPSFYIYRMNEGNRLFIGTRGTIDVNDAATDVAIREITTNKGVFIEGFYRSSLYVYNYSQPYIKTHEGPIYFIGHSMGGSVSTILHCLSKFEFGDTKDINTIALAPVPAISEQLNKSYGGKIVTVINSDDTVPTISIANMYEFLVKYNPFIPLADLPWKLIKSTVDFVLSLIYKFTTVFSKKVFEYFQMALNSSIDELVAYSTKEKNFVIRYPPGTVFQMEIDNPTYLSKAVVDPREKFNILSFSLHAFNAHDPSQYIKLLNATLGD